MESLMDLGDAIAQKLARLRENTTQPDVVEVKSVINKIADDDTREIIRDVLCVTGLEAWNMVAHINNAHVCAEKGDLKGAMEAGVGMEAQVGSLLAAVALIGASVGINEGCEIWDEFIEKTGEDHE